MASTRRMQGKVERYCASHNLTSLQTKHYYLACDLTRDPTQTLEPADRAHPILVCDLLPGKISASREFAFEEAAANWNAWHAHAEADAQVYNLIYAEKESFALESDPLGIKPVYRAETEGGTLVASSIADICSISPELSQHLDRNSIAQFLLMGYALGPRSFHKGLHRTETGERIGWSRAAGLELSRPRRYSVSEEIKTGIHLNAALLQVERAINASLERHSSGARKPINIALSGGFDSRILAAAMKSQNYPIRAFTYGRWHHRELRTARRIAKSIGIEHRLLDYPLDNYYQRLPLFMSAVEGQSESKVTQITNLLQIEADKGSALVHGFLSDPIAGSHLTDWFPNDDLESLDEVADRLVRALAPPHSRLQLVQKILDFKFDWDSFKGEVRSELCPAERPYQSAVLWDIENRQRKLISPHLLMLGQKFDVIAPFYDREMLQTWISMPRVALDKRYLQRQHLAYKFPELAKIPRDEETSPITPNLKNQLLLLMDTLARKAFIKLYGSVKGYRPESIWSLGQGMANASQIQKMNDSIRDGGKLLTEVFDLQLNLSDETLALIQSSPENGDYQTTRLIFQLVEYAKWIKALPVSK
ncbi:asparagine synthase-related protein [Denitrobaculum tricleocarpae]|nr:asparagine synthase-related protein [Denitrobaculum tricleocarpae]